MSGMSETLRHARGHVARQRDLTPDTDTRDRTNGAPLPWSAPGSDAAGTSGVSSVSGAGGAMPKGPASPGSTPSSAAPPFMRSGWGITGRAFQREERGGPGAGTPSRGVGPTSPAPGNQGPLCQPKARTPRPLRARYRAAHAAADRRHARLRSGHPAGPQRARLNSSDAGGTFFLQTQQRPLTANLTAY